MPHVEIYDSGVSYPLLIKTVGDGIGVQGEGDMTAV